MNIRVAHIVNPTFGTVFSGHTHYLFSLLSGWKDDDITLDIYGTRIKPLNLNSGERNYQLPQGTFWSKPERLTRKGRIFWSLKTLQILLARRNDYDIVHFHALNWGVFLSPIILKALGKKAVFTMSLYGNDNPGYIRQQPRGRLQVSLMRCFHGAIGLSPALVNDAREHGIRNVICLPNFLAIPELEKGLDESEIRETRNLARDLFGIPQNAQVLLFVGSVIKRKGVDILIDSFIELAVQYPSLVLVMVGPNNKQETNSIDEDFVRSLRKRISASGFSERVIWVGMLKEQATLVNYYRSADIFVLPTRNEGSPNVLAEAMAAYLPVVISRLPGITDSIISENESGFLVEPDDTLGFTLAIDTLLKNENKRNAMGKAGRKIAMEKFSFDSYCQKLKWFYLDLVVHQHHG
jgi:glycosyltransferase involved in cell wall biosynthesis